MILVTGATGNVGRSVVLQLAARGIREMRFILLGALHWNPAFGQVPLELLRPKP